MDKTIRRFKKLKRSRRRRWDKKYPKQPITRDNFMFGPEAYDNLITFWNRFAE